MKRIVTTAVFAVAFTLAACGSDGGGGGDGDGDGESGGGSGGGSGTELSDSQEAAAESAVESAAEDGITLERSCVDEVAAQLSEEDAVLAAADSDAELSTEGEALSTELIQCASDENLVEFFIGNLNDSGGSFDEDCLREQLGALDLRGLIASSAEDEDPPADFVTAIESCVSG